MALVRLKEILAPTGECRAIGAFSTYNLAYIETFFSTHAQNPDSYGLIGIPQACKETVANLAADKLTFFASGWRKLL